MKPAEFPNESAALTCPSCDSDRITSEATTQSFLYGKQREQVELKAKVTVYKCSDCDLQFTDSAAEEARNNAIREYLVLRKPHEIADIRDKHHLSRAEFAAISGIGTASLARWESGSLIQNVANDRYLYLLGFEENFVRIRALMEKTDSSFVRQSDADVGQKGKSLQGGESLGQRCRFRALPPDVSRLRARASRFKLRRFASK